MDKQVSDYIYIDWLIVFEAGASMENDTVVFPSVVFLNVFKIFWVVKLF